MTVKVGEIYQGRWCGKRGWLRITRIDLEDGEPFIYFSASFGYLPRFLSWFGTPSGDMGPGFVDRIKGCPPPERIVQSVREVEI